MLAYPEWYSRLRVDAERNAKLPTVEMLGEMVLRLFWEDGVEPTIDAMIRSVESGQ